MNILLLNVNTGHPSAWGGIEAHTEILGTSLHKKGYHVIMGCFAEGSVILQPDGLSLPSRRVTVRNSGDVRAVMRILDIIRKERIHLIIANSGREYWPAVIAAKIAGAKVIFIRHQVDRIRKTTRWLIVHYVERVVAVSKAVRSALLESRIPPHKIEVIPNSISLKQFNPVGVDRESVRKELGIDDTDIVVGLVGKLDRGKGVYDALAAIDIVIKEYPSVKLLFVGDGPERQSLEAESKRRSLSGHVIFAGVRRDVKRIYSAMDIFTLPSTCEEAFGMVLIEAMAMAKPVIATRVGGIPEILEHDVNGILVPPHDAGALAGAIRRCLSDRQFSERIAAAGRMSAEGRYSDEVMADHFEKVLTQIFSGKAVEDAGSYR